MQELSGQEGSSLSDLKDKDKNQDQRNETCLYP